jgi:thiazole synthase ThiGH ThiG subunit
MQKSQFKLNFPLGMMLKRKLFSSSCLQEKTANVPVLVDAGIGCASDAAKAME